MKKSPTTMVGSERIYMDKQIIEWQLPVKDDILNGTGYRIHINAKIHCFLNGQSLCSPSHWMIPGNFETTEYGEKDINAHPEYFYKNVLLNLRK